MCSLSAKNLKEETKMNDSSKTTEKMTKEMEEEQVKAVWEHTHVRNLGNGTVELINGTHRCIRRLHSFPEYQRSEE